MRGVSGIIGWLGEGADGNEAVAEQYEADKMVVPEASQHAVD